MALKLGLNCKAFIRSGGTWSEVGNMKDATLNLEKGEADVTTRGANGWKLSVATLKEGSVDFEMVWDTADANFTALQTAFFNDTAVEMLFLDGSNTTGNQGLHAKFTVSKFSRNEKLEDALTVSVTVKPTYDTSLAPSWATAPVA